MLIGYRILKVDPFHNQYLLLTESIVIVGPENTRLSICLFVPLHVCLIVCLLATCLPMQAELPGRFQSQKLNLRLASQCDFGDSDLKLNSSKHISWQL